MLLVGVLLLLAAAAGAQEQILVGRVTHVDNDVMRYVPDEEDWALVAPDTPLTAGDVFYSDVGGRAEIRFPGGVTLRMAEATKIEIDAVRRDLVAVYSDSGVIRFQTARSGGMLKVETPFGYMLAEAPAAFDLYVGDDSMEVSPLRGALTLVHGHRQTRYEISQGSPSLMVDARTVESGDGYPDPEWDQWNEARDRLLAQTPASRHLPEELQYDAAALAEHGAWEQVTYEGETDYYWRPHAGADWAPYTVGRWTTWYDEQVWVPAEPFGYVTHHYGGWVFFNGFWYWRPPRPVAAGFLPWCPGRVAWLYTDDHIAWVPLTWREDYYARHYWGPGTVLYARGAAVPHVQRVKLVNIHKTVVISKRDLYRGARRYEPVGNPEVVRQVNAGGRFAPVISREIVGAANLQGRHRFGAQAPSRKPHSVVSEQVRSRQAGVAARAETAALLKSRATASPKEAPAHAAVQRKVPEPRASVRIVKAAEAGKGAETFEQKPVKRGGDRPVRRQEGAPFGAPPPAPAPRRETPPAPTPATGKDPRVSPQQPAGPGTGQQPDRIGHESEQRQQPRREQEKRQRQEQQRQQQDEQRQREKHERQQQDQRQRQELERQRQQQIQQQQEQKRREQEERQRQEQQRQQQEMRQRQEQERQRQQPQQEQRQEPQQRQQKQKQQQPPPCGQPGQPPCPPPVR
jgi:hypothetical protein